jgi:hypothetical protein
MDYSHVSSLAGFLICCQKSRVSVCYIELERNSAPEYQNISRYRKRTQSA